MTSETTTKIQGSGFYSPSIIAQTSYEPLLQGDPGNLPIDRQP